MLNKALWCLTDTTRSARCDIISAGRWLNICGYRCLPLGAGCCCRASAAACLGAAGATGGCTAGAVGACCSCTASEVDGVVTGCPATSTLGCVSGLTASG